MADQHFDQIDARAAKGHEIPSLALVSQDLGRADSMVAINSMRAAGGSADVPPLSIVDSGKAEASAKAADSSDKPVQTSPPDNAPRERPQGPHYVAQANWDANHGLKDLQSGDYERYQNGEKEIRKALQDLNKEGELIDYAKRGGQQADRDILNGNTKKAEEELQKTIDGMKGNGFTSEARKSYEDALAKLKAGDTQGAMDAINSAQKTLTDRGDRVDQAVDGIRKGLKDFNSGEPGSDVTGIKEIKDALKSMRLNPEPGPDIPL